MKDGGATYDANTYYSSQWTNPLLDSALGFHNLSDWYAKWTTYMPSGNPHVVDQLILQIRGDNCCRERVITKVKIEYYDQNGTLVHYNGGAYVPTGQTSSTGVHEYLIINLSPFAATQVSIVVDAGGTNDENIHARYDFRVVPVKPAINQVKIECQRRDQLSASSYQMTTDTGVGTW